MGNGIHGGKARVNVSDSSQYLSSLLLTLPALEAPSTLQWSGEPVSWTYVLATAAALQSVGVRVRLFPRQRLAQIPGGQRPVRTAFSVPGDASSAAYLWAAAAISGGKVTVRGIPPRWPQSDLALLEILRTMGAKVRQSPDRISVSGPIDRPIVTDLSASPDLLPLVAVLAASIPRRSRIYGASHAAYKESDRRRSTVHLVKELGAFGSANARGLEVRGSGKIRPLRNRTLTDHRLVMSGAIGALAATGPSTVGDAAMVGKSFPGFWAALRSVGVLSRVVGH